MAEILAGLFDECTRERGLIGRLPVAARRQVDAANKSHEENPMKTFRRANGT
jgi:hypothetical protein